MRVLLWALMLVIMPLTSYAAIDAPHNVCSNMSCDSCHDTSLQDSPLLTGSDINNFCLANCHNALSAPYTDTSAPIVETHRDKTCLDCHDPHIQGQKNWKGACCADFYLAMGRITAYSCDDGGTACQDKLDASQVLVNPISTLTYSGGSFRSGWSTANIADKTSAQRRSLLLPNLKKLGWTFPVIAMDGTTITVKGYIGTDSVYEYASLPTDFAIIYSQYVRQKMDLDDDNIYETEVKFFDKDGDYCFANDESEDGTDETPDGVCQVCHASTSFWRSDGTLATHKSGQNCTTFCHLHTKGFSHTGGEDGGTGCDECHGHDNGYGGDNYYGTALSHSTHTENDSDDLKGPDIGCSDCHNTSAFSFFASGTDADEDGLYNLAETDVCDPCHSPGGTYNGAAMAKANWADSVYEADRTTLKAGKELWCAGCHDESPANSKKDLSGVDAPNVIGDEDAGVGEGYQYGTGYGFYKTGHGLAGGSYPVSGNAAANASCPDCHDTSLAHIDHDSRTYAAAGNNYQAGYRLRYRMDIPRVDTGWPESDFELCGQCHDLDPFLTRTNLSSNLRSVRANSTSTDLSETVLTDSTKAWGVNAFSNNGCVLIPDVEKSSNLYSIASNTETTVTVSGAMLTDGAVSGDSYRVECNGHRYHLPSWAAGAFNPINGKKWDSDWSATSAEDMQIDSMVSCPTCHNVHGSKFGRMARDGELISKIYNRRPALDFYYNLPTTYPNSTRLASSAGGRGKNGQGFCVNCHGGGWLYNRSPVRTASFTSAADQCFATGQPANASSTMTITENGNGGVFLADDDIRIRIPPGFSMTWDTTDTSAVMGGTAAAKVNGTVGFPDSKTLLIDVTTDFAANDTLTVAGLGFDNFSDISNADNLELYIADGQVLCTEDARTIRVSTDAVISSAADQEFAVGDWSTAVSPLTITAVTASSGINSTDDIRVKIPSAVAMVWDIGDTSAVVTGSASGKVSSTVSFPDEKTLLVTVTSDFVAGDSIIVSGLGFKGFYDTAAVDNLELYVDGAADPAADAEDDKTVSIESNRWLSPVDDLRGECDEEMAGYDTLIDGDLGTGNLWSGRNGLLDLGQEYLITYIRVYARLDNKWRFYAGNTPDGCLSDGVDLTGQWRMGHDGVRWYEKAVNQTSGRYIRVKWDNVGGYPGDNTIMEVEFFGVPTGGLTMTSAAAQEFEVGQAAVAVPQITITEAAGPVITAADDIRIVIPLTLAMSWDTTDTTATIGGTAAGKVSTTVSYPDARTLLINVTADFAANDTLTIEDLSFKDFAGQSSGVANLQLSVDGGTGFTTTDTKSIRIWDWITPVDVLEASPDCCDISAPGNVIDNVNGTGNRPAGGGYAFVDMGDTYTVTGIRIYTVSGYDYWDVSVGSDTTDCTLNTYGTQVLNEWYVNGDGWRTADLSTPVSGRYVRIDKDQGGGLNDVGLREVDIQGYKTGEGVFLGIASAADQRFEKDQAATAMEPINIMYYPEGDPVNTADDIRIFIPAGFNMTWDTTDTTAVIGGSASTKVSSTVSYPDSKTLLINVTENFSIGDTLTISGLSFTNFSDRSFKSHLEMSVDGGSTVAAFDSKYIWVVHWKSPVCVLDTRVQYTGATCSPDYHCSDISGDLALAIDGDLDTGSGSTCANVQFDLGSTQTVRHVRVYGRQADIWDSWTVYVSDDPNEDCMATEIASGLWSADDYRTGNAQWKEIQIKPTAGRYLKLRKKWSTNTGPVIHEIQYQSW